MALFTADDLASRIYQAVGTLEGFQGDAFALQGAATIAAREWFRLVPLAVPTFIRFVTSPEADPAYWRQLLDADLVLVLDGDVGNGTYRVVHPIPRHIMWKVN